MKKKAKEKEAMDISAIFEENENMWNDYAKLEHNALSKVTGKTMEEQLQSANREVTNAFRDFLDSDEYINAKQNMETIVKPYADELSRFDTAESEFYVYVPEDSRLIESADESCIDLTGEEKEQVIINDSNCAPVEDMPNVCRMTFDKNLVYDAIDMDNPDKTNHITGQEIYDGLLKYLEKTTQKTRGDKAEEALALDNETTKETKQTSPEK